MTAREISVLMAPRPVAAASLDALCDWSAANVLQDVLVVDQSAIRTGDFRMPAHLVTGGRAHGVSLQSFLADSVGIQKVRFVAAGRLRDAAVTPSLDIAEALVRLLKDSLPGVQVDRAQVIGVTIQGGTLPPEFAWLGWKNIVVAPEDSLAPGSGVERLSSDMNPGFLDSHLLTSIVTLLGAWAHTHGSPLDTLPNLPDTQVNLFRSFNRLLSADSVESELLERVASVDDGFPLPQMGSEQAWAVEDELSAVTAMGDLLIEKHRYVLPSERARPPARRARKIGAMQALRMLFGFLGAAIRNAPRAWAESVVRGVARGTASLVDRAVFGSGDSEYEVVVRGIRADGTPASWADLDEMANSLASKVGPSGNVQNAGQDLSGLWKDFVHGALTLLDGEGRSRDMPPIAVGAHRGVVVNSASVVPPIRDNFELSGSVAANIRGWSVEPADQIAARILEGEIDRVARDNPLIRAAALDDLSRLQQWRTLRERTYTGRIGYILGGSIAKTRAEILDIIEQLRAAEAALELPDDIARSQRTLAKKLRLMLVGAVGCLGILGLVKWLGLVQSTPVVVGLAIAVVLGWILSSFFVFVNGQRQLFALLHERQELLSKVEMLKEHLAGAISDLRRLIRAYRQYLDWTRALSVFVAAPNGLLERSSKSSIPLGAGLPRCIAFGEVESSSGVVDEVAARVRDSIYKSGWLTGSWDAFVADVPGSLGTRAFEVKERPESLWADQGSSERSVLSAWSRAVADRGPSSGAVAELRARVKSALASHPAGLATRLSSSIRTRSASGALQLVDYDTFIAGLKDLGGRTHAFDQSIFTHLGAAGEPWTVESTWTGDAVAALGGSVVVAQHSRGMSPTDLKICAPQRPTNRSPSIESGSPSTDYPVM